MLSSPYYRPLHIYRNLTIPSNSVSSFIKPAKERNDQESKLTDPPDRGNGLILSYLKHQRLGIQRGRRTILVNYNNEQSTKKCIQHCEMFGKIKNSFPVLLGVLPRLLVEYADEKSIQQVHQCARSFKNRSNNIMLRTRHFFYRDGQDNGQSLKYNVVANKREPLWRAVNINSSLSDQIESFYQNSKLSDYDELARYYVASTVEELFQGSFPDSEILMFGSSVSGLGRHDCDLDMALYLKESENFQNKDGVASQVLNSRLFYMTQMSYKDNKYRDRLILQLMSQLLRTMYPCAIDINEILSARVPIIRFLHRELGIKSDIAVDRNFVGPLMSGILHSLSSIDHRFSSLVFVVRNWAKNRNVTYDMAGPWLSNFMLTLLVVYYLQQVTPAVLPPLKQLVTVTKHKTTGQHTSEQYKILPVDQIPVMSQKNTMTTEDLLRGLFDFYTGFDFERGISVLEGDIIPNLASMTIYLQNPLEPDLNCSRNVKQPHLSTFQEQCGATFLQMTENCNLQQLLCHPGDETSSTEMETRINVTDFFEDSPSMEGVTVNKQLQDNESHTATPNEETEEKSQDEQSLDIHLRDETSKENIFVKNLSHGADLKS